MNSAESCSNRRAVAASALFVAGALAFASACGATEQSTSAPSRSPADSTPTSSLRTPQGDFAGLVSLGNSRSIYVECRGTGSPTVVLIAGKGNGGSDWSQVLVPADPIRESPLDEVGAGKGNLHDSDSAVFPSVAKFTRVCTYDRPDTRLTGIDQSTPRSQPHSVDLDVADLHTALAALRESGPYVLVAHSYGGFISELYARTYPSDVAGLVMVDAASSRLREAVTASKLAAFDQTNKVTSPQSPEGVEVLDALARLDAAPSAPVIPAVVLSADKPYRTDLAPAASRDSSVTFTDWLRGQELLAQYLKAAHVSQTNSGHNVYLYSPQLVTNAIHKVVESVRQQRPASTP